MSLQGTLCSRGGCWDLDRTSSPKSARHADDLRFIRIWATPPNRLVFWDRAPSPYSILVIAIRWKQVFWLCPRNTKIFKENEGEKS